MALFCLVFGIFDGSIALIINLLLKFFSSGFKIKMKIDGHSGVVGFFPEAKRGKSLLPGEAFSLVSF